MSLAKLQLKPTVLDERKARRDVLSLGLLPTTYIEDEWIGTGNNIVNDGCLREEIGTAICTRIQWHSCDGAA
jgi:hypothetical protein